MPNLTCPDGTSLVNGQCLYGCPQNYVILNSDRSMCVSTAACPTNTTEVTDDAMTCTKSSEPAVNGSCTRGAQYSPGICYYPSPCPAPFLESGFNCLKKTIPRDQILPQCSNFLLEYNDGECHSLSVYGWLLVISVIIIVAVLLYQSGVFQKSCSPLFGGKKKY